LPDQIPGDQLEAQFGGMKECLLSAPLSLY